MSSSSSSGGGEARAAIRACPPLTGGNWTIWQMKMRATLRLAGLAGECEPAAALKKETAKRLKDGDGPTDQQQRAFALLLMSLDDAHMLMVMGIAEGDCAGVWSELTKRYERTSTASKAHTRSMLHKTKMQETEGFDAYHSRIAQLSMKLNAMGSAVSEDELIYVVLEGLPASYSQLKQSLEVQDGMKYDKICDHVRDHQEKIMHRRANGDEEEIDDANYVRKAKGDDRGRRGGGGPHTEDVHRCALCKKTGHWEMRCKKRRGTGDDCWRCGEEGHQGRYCQVTEEEKADFAEEVEYGF
jgi:hypothetical protein